LNSGFVGGAAVENKERCNHHPILSLIILVSQAPQMDPEDKKKVAKPEVEREESSKHTYDLHAYPSLNTSHASQIGNSNHHLLIL